MTPTELIARQREREQAATPGPWHAFGRSVNGTPESVWVAYSPRNVVEDAALIVAARNDRALLLDVVEAARQLDDGWYVATPVNPKEVRMRYASDLPVRLNTLRAALGALFVAWEADNE